MPILLFTASPEQYHIFNHALIIARALIDFLFLFQYLSVGKLTGNPNIQDKFRSTVFLSHAFTFSRKAWYLILRITSRRLLLSHKDIKQCTLVYTSALLHYRLNNVSIFPSILTALIYRVVLMPMFFSFHFHWHHVQTTGWQSLHFWIDCTFLLFTQAPLEITWNPCILSIVPVELLSWFQKMLLY